MCKMWMHLSVHFKSVYVRVLHPGTRTSSTVEILCGLPKGSQINPTLYVIFVADLIETLTKEEVPSRYHLEKERKPYLDMWNPVCG